MSDTYARLQDAKRAVQRAESRYNQDVGKLQSSKDVLEAQYGEGFDTEDVTADLEKRRKKSKERIKKLNALLTELEEMLEQHNG